MGKYSIEQNIENLKNNLVSSESEVTPNSIFSATILLVGKYFEHNKCSPEDIADVIGSVHNRLNEIAANASDRSTLPIAAYGKNLAEQVRLTEEQIKATIADDYIICLEDGKKMRMLKRHLRTHYNMTPEEYKRKWGLPDDYPITAPNLRQRRQQIAKNVRPHEARKIK